MGVHLYVTGDGSACFLVEKARENGRLPKNLIHIHINSLGHLLRQIRQRGIKPHSVERMDLADHGVRVKIEGHRHYGGMAQTFGEEYIFSSQVRDKRTLVDGTSVFRIFELARYFTPGALLRLHGCQVGSDRELVRAFSNVLPGVRVQAAYSDQYFNTLFAFDVSWSTDGFGPNGPVPFDDYPIGDFVECQDGVCCREKIDSLREKGSQAKIAVPRKK